MYTYFPILLHDDVIKWTHLPRNWPFVRGIHRSPVNSRHKGQWRGALMFPLICVWINDWVNNREAGDLRRYRAHYDVIAMGTDKCRRYYAWLISHYPVWVLCVCATHASYVINESSPFSHCHYLMWDVFQPFLGSGENCLVTGRGNLLCTVGV